jgi:putative Mn2+ efflux pump MntP
MIWVGFRSTSEVDERPQSHSFWVLALTGLATSIDASRSASAWRSSRSTSLVAAAIGRRPS